MLEELIKINDDIIKKADDVAKLKKHLLIKNILNDDKCFLKMNIETSYAVLRELYIPEKKLKSIYTSLIEPVN